MKTNLPTRLFRLGFAAALFCALITGGDIRADLTLPAGANDPAASADEAVIAEALSAATSKIESFATTAPEAFAAVLRQAFGSRMSPEVERHFVEKAAQRQLPLPARILFVPDEILEGAYAAYAREEGGILFLNASYRGNTEALPTFLLHEWGHHLDALLGEGDSPMDEGMVFALGVIQEGPVHPAIAYFAGAHADDHRIITFEGRTLSVECFFKKLWGGIKKAAKAVANVAKAAVTTVVDRAKATVSFVRNTVRSVGNAVAGAAQGIASGVAHMTGNKKLGDSLAAGARSSFGNSFRGLKGAANDAVSNVAALGNLYNKTTDELNKVVPHLGTAMGVAAGFTPAGPALTFVKGVADVKNVVENGGSTGAIAGAVGLAALDFGLASAGGIKGLKNWPKVAKGIGVLDKLNTGIGVFRAISTVPAVPAVRANVVPAVPAVRANVKEIPFVPIGERKNPIHASSPAAVNPTALAPGNSRTINRTGGGGTSVNTAAPTPATLSLRGRVSGQDDKGSSVGVLPGAKIELFRADKSLAGSATANGTGFYHLPGLQAGSYTYRVSADGYTADDAGRGMVIPPGSGGQVFDFILSNNQPTTVPSGTMTGRAWEEKDGKRTPMAGVKVIAKLESAGSGYQESFTDREGVYSFTLAPGMWKASAVPIGLDSQLYPGVVTVTENASATADFVFSRESGDTPSNAGEVIALVSVPVGSAPTTPFVKFVNTSTGESTSGNTKPVTASGELRWYEAVPVSALKVGRYRAEADFQGFPQVVSLEKPLSAGQKTWFDIAFIPARRPEDVDLTNAGNPAANPGSGVIFGTVFRGEGRNKVPLASTMISLRPAAGGPIRTVMTDADGGYRLEVPSSDWQVSALTPDFKASVYPAVVSVTPGGEESAHFNFPADGTPGVAPMKDAYVMASVETDPEGIAQTPEIHFVSEDGSVRIPGVVEPIQGAALAGGTGSKSWKWFGAKPSQPLPEGTYRVQGASEGCESASTELKVVSNDASAIFDLALNRMRVDEPVDTTPRPMPIPAPMPEVDVLTFYSDYHIYGVTVQLVKKTPATGEGAARTVTLTTDDEGTAKGVLEDGEGAYSVIASAEGYRDYLGDVVVSEANRSLMIEMVPFPRADITVKDSAGLPLPGVDIRLVNKTRGQSLAEAAQQLTAYSGVGSFPLKDGYGDYALVASLGGYLPGSQELNLTEDPASPGTLLFEHAITLYKEGESRPVDFTGTLVELGPGHDKAYKDGKKIPNAQIVFGADEGKSLPEALAVPLRTGTEGEFGAKLVPEGTYAVSISGEGYEEYAGSLIVSFGMEPLLLSLKPRNLARDNWIRMILTEGWGDLIPSRQFHDSGTKEDPADSNVDYALGLSALQAKDKATSIPAFALAVGKLSNEKWWDRACEAHLWTLMHHQETASAVSEIRRLIAGIYGNRAESDESRDTAFLCGVAVGVMKGPWTMEGIGQLDSDITAALKGTHLTSYEAGKQSVAGRFTQLSEAEAKAKKDLADAAEGERARMLADLEKRVAQLRAELDANTVQQQTQNQGFTNYRNTAETNANTHTARLTELVAQADTLRTEIATLQEAMNSGMQAQANRRLEELQGGLTANLANQETEVQNFTNYRNGVEQTANNHVNRLTQISAELQQLAADFAKAQANPAPAMAEGGMARLAQIKGELDTAINQAGLLTERINALQTEAQTQINNYNAQLQQIVNDQTARQTRVNEINALPPYCPVCTNFAEKPADCEDCAQVRREREAEIIRLNQEFAQDQARDQEIRNLLEGVQNNYNAAVATYNEQIAPMQAQEAALREEYNRLAGEANKPAAPNPMLAEIQSRDAVLRTEYQETEAKHAALLAEYGAAEAEHLAKINRLREAEAALRAQMANTPAPAPGAGTEGALITEKTAAYARILQEYQDVEKQLATVQADYLREGEKHQQEIARLTELATALTNQINEVGAQMGSLPTPGTMPAGGEGTEGAEGAETRPSMAFATYFDYPLEQRRQELLGWVTRGANLGTPATQ